MTAPAHSRPGTETGDLAPFKELLLKSCGHSFEAGREPALAAALIRRMAALGIAHRYEAYHGLLLRDGDEVLRLTELLTVNETYFFREPDHLNLMVDTLLPELLAARNPGPVQIVSAGCSTGEEPYTVAIMLRERFGADWGRLFTITGVDIDSSVIASARKGVYGKGSFRGMERSLIERYFEPCAAERFQVKESIRKQVAFEVVNLLGASYPPSMQNPDIVLYRNVSIYFPAQVQREILVRLAELLADGGSLLVGASETLHHDIGILSLAKQGPIFFFRKIPRILFEERRTSRRPAPAAERAPGASHAATSAAGQRRPQELPGGNRTRQEPQPPREPNAGDEFTAALNLAHDQRHDQALAVLDGIIERDPGFVKAYCLKGSLLLSTSRFEEAHAACDSVLGRDPLCLEAYLMLGMIARQKGDNDAAVRRFREAIYLDASCWLAHFYSAEISFAQQDPKRARSGYQAALRILEQGSLEQHGRQFFPLSFNAEQFGVICRHKLSLLRENG